ncbi:hypothetical protein LTS08_002574 [Lithohypha guttulata]|uniref:DUF7707 domain-containing protein n=1 Tax=Lithohypha guttulata TaxID=1690604 RepID=A0AAN7T6I2_9EURO|nr:hypothetical protein LTR51_001745 [Lithohypha guttulata]KAK5090520.1 hypothetical protein LTR05_000693 [Lithohypha guttulata]KAK5104683.1 hypothetical protein LTS08_002574 [Lithohypha guttulata]
MFFRSILAASALVAFGNAQTIVTSSASSVAPSSTVAQSMPPTATQAFDANNVTAATKFQWCLAQLNTCPQICGGAASLNTCDSNTLMYSCTCPNGTVPDSTAYTQSLPFFVCQETYIQCVRNNPNNAQAQGACRTNQQCGTRNATAEALLSTSGASSSVASATSRASSSAASGTGSAASSAASATSSGSDASMTTITTGAFMAVLMAAFKLLL